MLAYSELLKLVNNKNITEVSEDDINSTSIDICMGSEIFIESTSSSNVNPYDPYQGIFTKIIVQDKGYLIRPMQSFLVSSKSKLKIPNNLAADFVLKSSLGRIFISHTNPIHIEPGFEGFLTIKLLNSNQQHSLKIFPNMPIGQLRFFNLEGEIPEENLYSNKGRYNNNQPMPFLSKGI